MTIDALPAATSVRRQVLLVIFAYTIPLFLTGGLMLVVSTDTYDWRPLVLFAAFLLLGVVDPMVWKLPAWRRERRRRRRPINPAARAAILADVPELSSLTMLVKGAKDQVAVDGSHLLIGVGWLGAIRPGVPLPDELLFALIHEARHLAVGTSWLLRVFRWLRVAYLAAAGMVYTGLLLNVAVIFDDPYRVALTISAVVTPYVAAALKVVLDAATNALEWRLELDADAAAANRCLAIGRKVPPIVPPEFSLEGGGVHPPLYLRNTVRQGRPAWRPVATTLMMGWVAVVIPLSMCVLFAWVRTETPDLLNGALAALYLTAVLATVAAVLAAARPAPRRASRRFRKPLSIVWLRIYFTTRRLLGWVMVACTMVLVVKATMDGWQGITFGLFHLAVVAVFVATVITYMMASCPNRHNRWVLAAALCDFGRLWIMVWLLRASGVLPYFDDLEGLGLAIGGHLNIIVGEAARMLEEEAEWLTAAAVVCAMASGMVALLVLRAKAAVLSDITHDNFLYHG
jgi:hypothetical protein